MLKANTDASLPSPSFSSSSVEHIVPLLVCEMPN